MHAWSDGEAIPLHGMICRFESCRVYPEQCASVTLGWQIPRHGIVAGFDSLGAHGGRVGTPSNTLTNRSLLSTLGEKVVTDAQGSTMGRCPALGLD